MNEPQTVTLPRELIERIRVSLTAAATSAAGRGLVQAADIYRTHLRELGSHLNPEPVLPMTPEQEAYEAGVRG